jgi:phage terminase small subunit
MGKLTPKQEKFVQEYLIDLNATQAAIRAGYSKKTARQIATQHLSKLHIQEAVARHMAEIAKGLIAAQEEVLQYLTRVMRGQEKALVSDRLRAAELLGKRYGLFTDKVNLSGAVTVTFEDDLGDEQ